MNKRILDLQSKRATLIEGMETLLNDGDLENWEARKTEVTDIDKQILALTEQEQFNRSLAGAGTTDAEGKEGKKLVKRFSLSKAVAEVAQGLTGVEAELTQEGREELRGFEVAQNAIIIPSKFLSKRATETQVTGADHVAEQVGGLDIITAPSMLEMVGVTQLEGLTANVKIPFSNGHDAAFFAEGATADESTPTNTKGNLTARRVQGWKGYSTEYLAQSSVMPAMLSDMVESLDRAIWGEVCATVAIDANAITGKLKASTTAAPTYKAILELLASVEGDTFRKDSFVMSKALYHNLEGVDKATSAGRFVIEGKKLNGVNAFGTSKLPLHNTTSFDIVYGDFARAYVGKFGGIQIVVDPYTLKKDGEVEISFARMADVTANPAAFKAILNAGIA